MSDRAEIAHGLVSCSLKRKRPLTIEIPNVLSEISVDVLKERGGNDGPVCFADSGVGVYSLKGKKKFMEDSYKVFASANGDKTTSEDKAKEAACARYLKTYERFLKQGLDSGACCVTALIEGREMVVSNFVTAEQFCAGEVGRQKLSQWTIDQHGKRSKEE
ncbi:hypothetical protein C2S52_020416 [Perilla frutescens var. hirtella]|nr:hypothetical protein C2S52_020416 [Perilla frutescens var. hirtella]